MTLDEAFDVFPRILLNPDALAGGANGDEPLNGFPARCGLLQIAQQSQTFIGQTSALNELSELDAYIGKCVQQTVIWRADFFRQEFHDSNDPFRVFDWESEGSMEMRCTGEIETRKVIILHHVRDPIRLTASQYATGKANTR